MKVIIRTIAATKARTALIAQGEFEHGAWVSAAERIYNEAKGYEGLERRFLISDTYLGGSFAQPFGLHTVFFARYDPEAVAYRFDEQLRLEVTRE